MNAFGTDRRRETLPAPTGLPDAAALGSRPRVVVVGGGIAGLTAATGLAERGVAVEVIEREDYLGGRVGGWTERQDGVDLAMNRGFHAFFRQYYNLRALLGRIDPHLRMLTPVDDYPLIDGAGRRDTFRGLPRTPPWNAVAFAARSPTFRLRDFLAIDARAAAPLAAVSVPGIYERLDHFDAATFLKSIRFPAAARHLAFEVFSRSFFADPAKLSAAELATMFHIYFLGSSEGLIFDVPTSNYDTALWQPLRRYLEARDVNFRLGTGVSRIDVAATKPFRVHTDSGDAAEADAVVLATDVAGLQRVVGASTGLGTDDWRAQIAQQRTAPPFAVHRLWLDRPVSAGRRPFWVRPDTNRWTTSASWSATNGRPPSGHARTTGPSSSCTPTPSTPRRPARPPCANCTRYTRKPRRRRSFPSGCCTAATAHCSHPGPMRGGRKWSRRNPACCWPATPSASTCPWHSWSARPPQVGAPRTIC